MKGKDELRIIGLIRAKNAAKYLPELLGQMSVFCNQILLLDGGSVDDTVAIAKGRGAMVRLTMPGSDFHEGRDRIHLHRWAEEFSPDWIYAPDTDELLEAGGAEKIRDVVFGAEGVKIEALRFPFLYLWGDRRHYRVDGIYRDITAVRLFKYFPDLTPPDREVHSMAVPMELLERGKFCRSEIRLLHFGYMAAQDRAEKYRWNCYHYPPGSRGYAWAGGKGYDHILGRDAEIEEM